jgi:hypothetical protein
MTDTQEGVYFIIAPNQKKIKIGHSKDITRRHKNLKTGFMDRDIHFCSILVQDPDKLESKLHKEFKHLRAGGEWFYLTRELVEFLNNIKSIYPSAIYHVDPKVLNGIDVYSDVKTHHDIEKTKRIILGIVIPLLLFITGVILAYCFIELYRKRFESGSFPYWSLTFFIFLPYVTIVLPRSVKRYCTSGETLWYFSVLALNMILAAVYLTSFKPGIWFTGLQVFALIFYIYYSRHLLLKIYVLRTEEMKRKTIGDQYSLNRAQLLSRAEVLTRNKNIVDSAFIKFSIAIGILMYVSLHVVLLLSEDTPQRITFLLLGVLNAGVLILGASSYLKGNLKVRPHIISAVIFLIVMLASTDDHAFADVFIVMAPELALAAAFLLWYSIKSRRIDSELDEILRRIKLILNDLTEKEKEIKEELKKQNKELRYMKNEISRLKSGKRDHLQ